MRFVLRLPVIELTGFPLSSPPFPIIIIIILGFFFGHLRETASLLQVSTVIVLESSFCFYVFFKSFPPHSQPCLVYELDRMYNACRDQFDRSVTWSKMSWQVGLQWSHFVS